MRTTFPDGPLPNAHCTHPNHEPKLDDGEECRRDLIVQLRHPTSGWNLVGIPGQEFSCAFVDAECGGYVHDGIRTTKRADGTFAEYPVGAPCPVCRPGRRAVWAGGYDRDERGVPKADWPNDPRAREAFFIAQGRWPSWLDRRGERQEGPMPGEVPA